jgi:hypothetical protein
VELGSRPRHAEADQGSGDRRATTVCHGDAAGAAGVGVADAAGVAAGGGGGGGGAAVVAAVVVVAAAQERHGIDSAHEGSRRVSC